MICTGLLQILALFSTLCLAGFVHSVNHRYDIISSQHIAHIEVNVLISCERLSPGLGYTSVTMMILLDSHAVCVHRKLSTLMLVLLHATLVIAGYINRALEC